MRRIAGRRAGPHLLVDELAVHGLRGVRIPLRWVVRGAKDDLQRANATRWQAHDGGNASGR